MKKLLIATLLTLTSAAFAGDAAKLTHIGFSADGSQYAYMQSGVADGSGFAYATIRFLDTANNKYSAAAVNATVSEAEENDSVSIVPASVIEARALRAAQATLKKLGISSEYKGEVVVSR